MFLETIKRSRGYRAGIIAYVSYEDQRLNDLKKFLKFECSSHLQEPNKRFEYFTTQVYLLMPRYLWRS